MEKDNIKEILLLVKEKKPAGFELLYSRYFRFMFSVAYSVLDSEEDSYDVIQSVMLRLYMTDERLFPSEGELGWLKTVVKNEALMKLRKYKNAVFGEIPPELPVQDRRIDEIVDMEQFKTLTGALDERRRRVVTLKIMGGMTHREISRLLSIPIGTVQWLYNTSVKELRRAMTALAALVFCCGSGMIYQIYKYFSPGQAPGDVGIAAVPAEAAVSPRLPASIALFALSAAVFAIFFVFSDRLPTKRLSGRI